MSQANKDLVRRFFTEVMNKGNLKAVDEICAPTFVSHQPGSELLRGPEGVKQMANMYRNAFPDARMTVEDQVAEGDKVVTRWSATGTHRGELMGIKPTGKKIAITGITVDRIVNGKVVEEWESYDQMSMMQQLGAIPSAGQAR